MAPTVPGGPDRDRRLARGIFFAVAVVALPAGGYGAVTSQAAGAVVAAVGGALALGVWWLLRPRYRERRAGRLAALGELLSVAVAAVAVAAAVTFLASPAEGASLGTRAVTLGLAAASLALLAVRVLVSRRLAAVLPGPGTAPKGTAASVPGLGEHPELAERGDPELTALRQAWQQGEPLSAPGLAGAPGGALILRAARSEAPPGRRGAAHVACAALLLVLIGLRALSDGLVTLVVTVAAAMGLLITALTVIALIRARGVARLTAAELSAPTWYGRQRRAARDQVQRVVLVTADLSALRPLAVPMLLVLGDGGRCLLPVSGAGVAVPALRAFAAATGAPAGVRNDPLDAATLRREYPGSLSWYWAHQILTGVLISVALLALVTATVLAG